MGCLDEVGWTKQVEAGSGMLMWLPGAGQGAFVVEASSRKRCWSATSSRNCCSLLPDAHRQTRHGVLRWPSPRDSTHLSVPRAGSGSGRLERSSFLFQRDSVEQKKESRREVQAGRHAGQDRNGRPTWGKWDASRPADLARRQHHLRTPILRRLPAPADRLSLPSPRHDQASAAPPASCPAALHRYATIDLDPPALLPPPAEERPPRPPP